MHSRKRAPGPLASLVHALWIRISLTRWAWVVVLSFLPSPGLTAVPVGETILGPAEESVLRYEDSADLNDPVARLQRRLQKGQARLSYTNGHGYLPSLLQQLGISVTSQTLVFSKTSSQAAHTSPRTPRALYFNDQSYVGWVPGGETIDVVGVDSRKGPIFYTLEQRPEASPHFVRRNECLSQCHLGPKTQNVPGLFVRSILTTAEGRPRDEVRDFVSGHGSPLERRWAGWFVTGTHSGDQHLGNAWLPAGRPVSAVDLRPGSNVTDLRPFTETPLYLSPHSDTVALMVLDHSVRLQNLLTQATYETRLAQELPGGSPGDAPTRIARAGDALLTYLLFRDEAPLHGAVTGTSDFARDFALRGPRDHQGRSLREFDLQRRLFRYPCSYLIYSPAFDALPGAMKSYLYPKLRRILRGQESSGLFGSLTAADRTAVEEILRATKPEFRDWPAE